MINNCFFYQYILNKKWLILNAKIIFITYPKNKIYIIMNEKKVNFLWGMVILFLKRCTIKYM